ncbi:DUF4926 domain-containing protein [Nocardia sp. NPDC051750]|uniref:DUF4926 domain-containing protein n=1 Tax=Nocardia sp. NPDC051750 TaxID=3364325 RepID=UPI00379780A5
MPAGSIGAVVAVYGIAPPEVSYDIEFVAEDGGTIGIVTLTASDLVLVSRVGRS